jgi:PhzF family phenazine biosynthesis protein
MTGVLRRLSAFTTDPDGGNPAGVWIGEELPDVATMQRIAAEVGFSETAFVAPTDGADRTVRYFSPLAEVPFCGHATIAAGVALGESSGDGTYRFATAAGEVPVTVEDTGGVRRASLTSVPPRHTAPPDHLIVTFLVALGWDREDLDPAIPPVSAYAGAWHLVLAVSRRERLASLEYDFTRLQQLMLGEDLTTLQLVWREDEHTFHSRNPFPVGGVVEDPATGAAAAALGGYLRDAHLIETPAVVTIHQGHDMGRPSLLTVTIPARGGVVVSGTAVDIDGV